MKMSNILTKATLVLFIGASVISCKKDEETAPEETPVVLQTKTINYAFNTGQLDKSFAYDGTHASNLSAEMKLEEQSDGSTKITVTLNNTVKDSTYHIHAHDVADPTTTPNKTPYNEAPNGDVFIKQIVGNGSSMSTVMMSKKSFVDITTTYSGFFVVHDPLQAIDTKNPKSYVILGSFAR